MRISNEINIVSWDMATFQIPISALIQTTYCSVLKFIITLVNDECVKTQFYTHMGDEEKLL